MPKAKALKNYKIVDEVKIFWRLVAVGNGSKTPLFYFFSAFDESMSIRLSEIFVTLWVLVVVINSRKSGCVGWVCGGVNCLGWGVGKMGRIWSYYQGEMWATDSCEACLAELSTNC